MQPPPRKVKLSQEVKVHFAEQLSCLQNKQQRDTELLEDIRSYSKQRAAIEREYGQALQRLASQFLKRDWQRGRSELGDSRSVFAVWKGVIDSTMCVGQARVTASEIYRSMALEVAKTTRMSKEHLLKKSMEQLQKVQAEFLETVKEVDKSKKQFMHLQRVSEVAKEKAADVEARLQKSDHGIFHTKGSLQKLSTKFSGQLAQNAQQLAAAQNEYLLTLGAANAHLEHYYCTELPSVMKTLDGDLYEWLRDHMTLISQTEIETCHITQERFHGVLEASTQVCREQNLLLFLQDHTAFTLMPKQHFQPEGINKVCLLEPPSGSTGESGLEKEARRWATRTARDYKIKTHSGQMLQRMEARRQQASEAEVAGMERRMEEVRENVRKAEVSKVKADARLTLLRQTGLDVDAWLSGAMGQVLEELEQERRLSEARKSNRESTTMAEEFDLAEFEDYDDDVDLFEDTRPSTGTTCTYPYTCRVIFGYQACQADELSISQGEELEVTEDGDMEEWVKGRNKVGQIGYIPEKYLLVLDSMGNEQRSGSWREGPSETALDRELTNIMNTELVLEPGVWLVRALYDYEGQSAEELTFPEGAIIQVLPREEGDVDDGFWRGDFNGRIGVFPSLVVEEITRAGGAAGQEQELSSPSPPAFSPPVLLPGARLGSSPSPEVLLGGCRQDGTASEHSSPDLTAARIRPLRAPPPPPAKAPEAEPELHLS
ncbi:F-BAR and double SH3 domains protein 1 isoform X2 [Alligator mississippiensis]|uniref:F-BAR and double SH3 domains protein 1 isoform A n=1 Tax=Alligator mississippiensis TaxID=8496 RepID=A0A151NRA3_ALLMI|nr:F-BAR and double SH3 domains protein 1 isoform X2 [Alligator mississippiensis]KYO39328.1 F-BAR and double SH3 domains protein 1 isoform A [Alligator mississippiensis]